MDAGTRMDAGPVSGSSGQLSNLFTNLFSNLFSGPVCLSEYTGADCCPVFVSNKSSHFFGCGKKIMIGIKKLAIFFYCLYTCICDCTNDCATPDIDNLKL